MNWKRSGKGLGLKIDKKKKKKRHKGSLPRLPRWECALDPHYVSNNYQSQNVNFWNNDVALLLVRQCRALQITET